MEYTVILNNFFRRYEYEKYTFGVQQQNESKHKFLHRFQIGAKKKIRKQNENKTRSNFRHIA